MWDLGIVRSREWFTPRRQWSMCNRADIIPIRRITTATRIGDGTMAIQDITVAIPGGTIAADIVTKKDSTR